MGRQPLKNSGLFYQLLKNNKELIFSLRNESFNAVLVAYFMLHNNAKE